VFDGQAVHVASAVAPVVVKYVPAPQSVHATVPVTVLYFPTAHAAHVPPLGFSEKGMIEKGMSRWDSIYSYS
jgi:hypothetical protein